MVVGAGVQLSEGVPPAHLHFEPEPDLEPEPEPELEPEPEPGV